VAGGVAGLTSQAFHRFPQPDLGVVVVLHFKELLTQLEAILPAHIGAKNKSWKSFDRFFQLQNTLKINMG